MKILPFNPKSSSLAGNLDDSRLGNHITSISPEDLTSVKHGIVIIGLADDGGIKNVGGRAGAKDGPQAARQKFYKFTLGKPANPVYDLGDLLPEKNIEDTHKAAANLIQQIHKCGHTPIVIGGGHDLAFPEAKALLDTFGQIGVCNIDAHLDLRSIENGISSGSPWYLLNEYPPFHKSKSKLVEFGIQRHCNAHSLVEYAEKKRVEIHWLEDLAVKNRLKKFQQVLIKLAKVKAVQVSLDIDSVVWSEAPGCSAPQVKGFTSSEAIEMSYLSGKNTKTRSFGIYELSPAYDDGRTATLVAHCIAAFIQGFATRSKKK